MKSRFLVTILVAFLVSAAFAQQDKGTSVKAVQRMNRAPVNRDVLQVKLPRPTEIKLPNGLTVLLIERHRVPTVNFSLWIGSGSLDDPKDMPGLAKFTADMLQEGTARRSSAQISVETDALGATLNADSEFGSTYTEINASGFSENADQVLDLMADVVLNAAFPGDELEKYKQRTLADLDEERSQPGFLAGERLHQALYGNSPAAIVSPTAASVKAATAEELRQFRDQHYAPNDSLMGVAGDFDTKQMTALVEKYFGGWKPRKTTASSPVAGATGPSKIYLVDRPDSVQTNILAGELAVPRNNPDYIPLRVMNQVLGEGTSGRLFLNLREDKGYTYGAYSSFDADTYPKPLIANTEVRTAVTDGSMHELLGELKRLRDEPVPSAELEEARRAMVANFALSLEHQTTLLSLWMRVKHNGLAEDYWDRYPAEIAKTDSAAVQRVAGKYLDPAHLQVVCVGSGKEIKDTLAKYGAVEVYDVDGKKVSP